jgi:hypothetical protein
MARTAPRGRSGPCGDGTGHTPAAGDVVSAEALAARTAFQSCRGGGEGVRAGVVVCGGYLRGRERAQAVANLEVACDDGPLSKVEKRLDFH